MEKHITLIFFCLFFFLPGSKAVPAYPHPVTIIQPDGTTLTVQLSGDEFRRSDQLLTDMLSKRMTRAFIPMLFVTRKTGLLRVKELPVIPIEGLQLILLT